MIADVKQIVLGMLVLIYGIAFYIVGRTNLLEKFITIINNKLNDMLNEVNKNE